MKHSSRSFLVRAVALLMAWACSPGGAAAQDLKPDHIAQALERSIRIGGNLNQWNGLPQYPIRLSNSFPVTPVSSKAYFSLAWDSGYLYVLGVFTQPKDSVVANLKADVQEWWHDDLMELFIRTDPFAKPPTDLHFAVNPAGERFKSYTASSDYQSAARIEANRWVLELAIPLGRGVLGRIQDGTVWGLKVGREYQRASEFPLWPMGGDFNAATNYGLVVFGKTLQDQGALFQKLNALVSALNAPIKSQLSGIDSFAVYYGSSPRAVEQLSNFKLAVVQPTLTAAQLTALHRAGTRAVAYLSIGAISDTSPLLKQIPREWLLPGPQNRGSSFVDANQPGWQKLLLAAQNDLLAAGYDGVFLDNIDAVDLYPELRPGLVSIVTQMRAAHPKSLLVQNRGFTVLNQTAELLDAVMLDGFSSRYNFQTERYEAVTGDPNLVLAYQKRGLVVLCLDYAAPEQQDMVGRNYARAREFGFIPYVTTILFDQLFIVKP